MLVLSLPYHGFLEERQTAFVSLETLNDPAYRQIAFVLRQANLGAELLVEDRGAVVVDGRARLQRKGGHGLLVPLGHVDFSQAGRERGVAAVSCLLADLE